MPEGPQRVEIVIPLRTMLSVLAFAGIVALALLSLDTLISVFLSAIIALGLDPVVSALVRRGWKRGRAAFTVFLGVGVATTTLVLLAVGPFWDEVKDFVKELPAYWDNFTNSDAFQTVTSAAGADDKVAQWLKDLASGLP